MIPSELPLRPRRSVEQNDQSRDRGHPGTTNLGNITTQDHARLQVGDQIFQGPVTVHNAAAAPADKRSAQEKEHSETLKSLVFDQMDSRFMNVHPHLTGTCEWLLHTPEWEHWNDPGLMHEHHGFLWIKGKAGIGKSTLMKYAADLARSRCKDQEYTLTCFFNARGGPMETSPSGLFRTMLHQLSKKVPGLYEKLDERRLGVVKRESWTSALIQSVFREAVMLLGRDRITCYIDAMDECRYDVVADVVQSLDDLADLATAHERQFYVCLSSRHYPNLKTNKGIELILERQEGHENDIRQYIRKRLLIDDEDLKTDLARKIEKKASGVFLWVILVVTLLNRDDSRGDMHAIHKHLDEIPAKLSELFNELLGRDGTGHVCLRPLLRLIIFATRPLTRCEFYEASLFESNIVASVRCADEETERKFILEVSKGLVEANSSELEYFDSTVQLIHESVRTYFLHEGSHHLDEEGDSETTAEHRSQNRTESDRTNHSQLLIARCHDQIKRLCLRYVEENWNHTFKNLRPFFEYATKGVMSHAEMAQTYGLPQRIFLETFPKPVLEYLTQWSKEGHQFAPSCEPWHRKAFWCISKSSPAVLRAVLEAWPSSAISALQWRSLLDLSIENRHAECTFIILQAGADPDIMTTDSKRCCLHLAIEVRAGRIIEHLLAHGAKPYMTNDIPNDCINEACHRNDAECMGLLLGEHFTADNKCTEYKNSLARALGQASYLGYDRIFHLLVTKGAETGLWSPATCNDGEGLEGFAQITFEEEAIMSIVLDEGVQVVLWPDAGIALGTTLRFRTRSTLGDQMPTRYAREDLISAGNPYFQEDWWNAQRRPPARSKPLDSWRRHSWTRTYDVVNVSGSDHLESRWQKTAKRCTWLDPQLLLSQSLCAASSP